MHVFMHTMSDRFFFFFNKLHHPKPVLQTKVPTATENIQLPGNWHFKYISQVHVFKSTHLTFLDAVLKTADANNVFSFSLKCSV